MTFIRDPITQRGARVDNDERLRVQAIADSLDAEASRKGEAFTIGTSQSGIRALTFAASDDGPLLYIRNNSSTKVLVADGFTATEAAAGMILYLVKNPILGTLGANTPVTPSNRNFASTNAADVQAEVWDDSGAAGITGLTGGEEVASFLRSVPAGTLDLRNAIRLGREDSAYFAYENPTGGPIGASVVLRFHMEDIEVF